MDPWSREAREHRVERRIWRTTAGEEIPYEKLRDDHLLKILAHLRMVAMYERGDAIGSLIAYRPTPGSGAADAAEDAMDGFLEELEGMHDANSQAHSVWRKYARPEFELLEELAKSRRLDLAFLEVNSAAQTFRAEMTSIGRRLGRP